MKVASSAILLAAAIFVCSQGTITRAADVDIGFFYDNLGSHGEWVEVPDYGHCWTPRSVAHGWRPYSLGHWVWADESGWTWVSDEPFGWITYHYGRWVLLQDTGWCWVPDTVWGPAWVSFRHSEEYVGWAPLPPEAYYRTAGFGAWVDAYYDIGPSYYSFVPLRRFGAHNIREVIVDDRDIINIYSSTRNITRIENRGGNVFLGGLEYDQIASRLETPIQRVQLERQFDVQAGARARIEGNRLLMPSPNVRFAEGAAPKGARRLDSAKVDRGWAMAEKRDAGKVKQLREQLKGQAQAPSDLAPQPKFDKKAQREAAETATQAAGTKQEGQKEQQQAQGMDEQQPPQDRQTMQDQKGKKGKRLGFQQQQDPLKSKADQQKGKSPKDQTEQPDQMKTDTDTQQETKSETKSEKKGKKGAEETQEMNAPGSERSKGKSESSDQSETKKSKKSDSSDQPETQKSKDKDSSSTQKKDSGDRYGFQKSPGEASRKSDDPGSQSSKERSTRYGFQNQPGKMSERSKQGRTQESQAQPQQLPQQKKQDKPSGSMQQQSSGGESQQGVQRGQEGRERGQVGPSGPSTTVEEKSKKSKKGGD